MQGQDFEATPTFGQLQLQTRDLQGGSDSPQPSAPFPLGLANQCVGFLRLVAQSSRNPVPIHPGRTTELIAGYATTAPLGACERRDILSTTASSP